MLTVWRSSFYLVLALIISIAASACGADSPSAAEAQPSVAPVQLAPENVVTAAAGHITSGPAVSGQLTPAREAKVRAQVGGALVALRVDRGDAVRAGQEIARITSRDLEAAFESTQAAVKSAEATLQLAKTEAARTQTLVKGGALAARDLEQAENAVSNAEAQLAAVRARQRSAWQQLDDTTLKAPFAGIVSDRPASLGDVVAPGAEILTIIDPSSMRLEALVPSDQVAAVKRGAVVDFTIRGVPGTFTGRVDRISPAADPVTRQVSVFVSIPNVGNRLIAGLFAEGHVTVATRDGIVVPSSAVDETKATPVVTRIRDGKAERVPVVLGERQTRTEQVEVTKGVAAGDMLILGSAKGVAAGTPVKVIQ
jgi:RND family efflux transporter MFP subunit